MKTNLWHPQVTFRNHHYWHKKARFQLETDHYEFWVIFAVEEGSFNYGVRQRGQAGFGDLVLCPPGIPFWREVITPLSFHYLEFYIVDEQEDLARTLPSKITLRDVQRLSSTYHHLRALEHQTDPLSQSWKNHLLYDIFALYQVESQHQQPVATPEDPLMARAAQYLQQHAKDPSLSLRALASSLSLSPVQLTRKFQAAFGVSPSAYLTSLRLQKARALLLETADTLDEIAERCGYENGFYLSRVFSKKMNMSPSAFRKTYRV